MGVSGGLANLGPPIRDGALLAVKQVNNADTDFSVDHQFEDTGTDPNQGISGGQALVNAGYPMLCGALSSAVSLQVAQNVAVSSGVPMCSPASTSPELTTVQDNDLFYRTPPTDALQGRALAQIAAEEHGAKTAATFYLNQAYGQGIDSAFADAFSNQQGGEVTAQVAFEPGQSSYTSQLNSALQGDPDTMVIVAYPESGVQILRDFYAEFDKADMPLLVTDGLQDGELPGNVGNDLANVTGTAPLAKGPGKEFVVNNYVDEYGSEPGVGFTWYAYDASAVLLLANAAAGENDGAAIKEQMRNIANPEGTEVTPQNLVEGIEMAASGEEIQYSGASSAVDFDDAGDMKAVTYEYFGFTSDGLETIREIQFSA